MPQNPDTLSGVSRLLGSMAVVTTESYAEDTYTTDEVIGSICAGMAVDIELDTMPSQEQIDAIIEESYAWMNPGALVMAHATDEVNIRESATTDSEIVGKLYSNCGGYIIEYTDTWTKIKSGNAEGWVCNDYLYFGSETQNIADDIGNYWATVTASELNVRSESNTESDVLGTVNTGDVFEVFSNEDGWVAVDYEGKDGFISADYVSIEFHITYGESIQPDAVAAGELYRFDTDHLRESAGEGWILINRYESDDVIDRYISDTLSGKELSCSANEAYTERHPSYDVYADDLLLGTITLKHKTESDEFGFCDYEFSELQVLLGGPEMETYTIKCYEGDDVYVNGEKLEADDETVFLTEDTQLDSYMSQAASAKSGVSINECVYTLTDFIDEPEVTLEKYDNTYTVSDNSLRDEIVAVGDEDTRDSDHYFNACVFFDDQLDYDLNDRLYNGFVVAGENFIYNMNLWGSFANVSKYLESGGAAYNAIASAQSGLSWAGRPDEFEIKSTEILSIVKYDDDTLVVTTYHTIHRLYRSVTYEEDMTVEWLYCKNGNAWLIRNFSYL